MKNNENSQEDFFDLWVYRSRLPKDHPLLQIKRNVDFSFVDEETKDLYSDHMGRPAYSAGVLFRMLFLEFFDNLSDVEVASQVQYGIPENLSNLLSACGLCTLEAREREWLTVQERGTVFLYFAPA